MKYAARCCVTMAPPTKAEIAKGLTKTALVERLLASGYKKCKYTRSQLAAKKRDELVALVHKRDLEELAGLPRTAPLKKRACAAGAAKRARAATPAAVASKQAKQAKKAKKAPTSAAVATAATPRRVSSFAKPRAGDKVMRFRIVAAQGGQAAKPVLDAVTEPFVVGDFFTTAAGDRYIKTANGRWDYMSNDEHQKQQQAYHDAAKLASQ